MITAIGLIVYGLDRAPGGIGRYTRELGAALTAAGVTVTILHAGKAGNNGAIGLRGAARLPGLLTIGQAQIARAVRQRGLDLVHDPTGIAPVALVRAPRVITVHDVIPYLHPETSTVLDRLIYRAWLPLVLRGVDAVITVSEQSRADLLHYLPVRPDQVAVVPQGVGPAFRPLEPAEIDGILARHGIERPYVLYVGSIEARKNLARLLEAFASLRTASPDLRLVLVGARKLRSSPVFKTLGRLRLEQVVQFTGYVGDADLPALYNGSEMLVFPSLYEGFGLPVLEAMACGTPVITSRVSALPEVAGDAALFVDPLDVAGLADAMSRLRHDTELASRLRRDGLARARQFTWRRTAEATMRVYERVLGRPIVTRDGRDHAE